MAVALCFVFLVASVAGAAPPDWVTKADGTTVCTGLSSSRPICFYDFANTTASDPLAVLGCKSVQVEFNPDEDGTATGAEIDVYRCSVKDASTDSCVKVCADRSGTYGCDTLNGDEAAQRAGFQGIQTAFIWIDVTLNGGSDDARVTATCH